MCVKRLTTFAICLLTLILALSGCESGAVGAVLQEYTEADAGLLSESTVYENGRYALQFDKTTARVTLYDKDDQSLWGTVPSDKLEVRYDEYGMPIKTHPQLESAVYVDYYTKDSTELKRLYSYSGSVSKGTYSAEKIDKGLSVTYSFAAEEISVTVDYTVCDYGMQVTVDPMKMAESDNKICRVAVSPFFCSVGNLSENGYLFVPSGSGALIYPKQIEDGAALTYSEEVYGRDASVAYPSGTKATNTQSIRMPIFGAKDGGRGVAAMITEGAESAEIFAQIGAKNVGYSAVYALFNVRGKQLVYSEIGNKTYENTKYSDNVVSVPFSVIYAPLKGENADYSGMARTYRDYLTRDLKIAAETEETAAALRLIGGVMVPDSFLGIPYERLYVATTYAQACEILDDFTAQSGISPVVLMTGYSETGIDIGTVAGGFETNSKFGKTSELAQIRALSANLYLDFDLVNFSKSARGFSVSDAAARGANGQISYQYHYNIWSGLKDEARQRYVLLARGKTGSAARKLAAVSALWEHSGVCLSTLSSTAYSDYTEGKYVAKSGMSEVVSGAYEAFRSNQTPTASSQANLYAALASDFVFEAPTASSGYDVFAETVPFYQMVLKGIRPLTASSVNGSSSETEAILQAAETGTSLLYDLSYEYSSLADSSYTQVLYNTVYADRKDTIADTVRSYSEYFDAVKNAVITEHEILDGGLRKTVFDNGVTVYVNYGDAAADTPLGRLEAKSYCYAAQEVSQ